MTIIRRFIGLACVVLTLGGIAYGQTQPAPSKPVNFGGTDNVLTLKPGLTPYHSPGGPEADGSSWYLLPVMNDGLRPATRVLLAGQPPSSALHILPRRSRPAILAVAS